MNNLDATALIQAGRKVNEPFQLEIRQADGASDFLLVRKILRLLPRKRIVAVADFGDRIYLVKIFIGRYAGRYTRREVNGVYAIEDAGVLTPCLEWQASLAHGGGYVLGFEYIEDAYNFIDVWKGATDDAERLGLISQVIPVLAMLHEGGVVQNDIHPENFLFRNNRIYTIDGGDVSSRGRSLSQRESLENLGLFFAQFHAVHDGLVPELLDRYRLARDWSADHDRYRRLMASLSRQRKQRKQNYIGKAFRECTRFHCEKRINRFTVYQRQFESPGLTQLLDNLDEQMAEGAILKDGNTATVSLVEVDGRRLVVKRYNIKGLRHSLSRMFRKSRAWKSWANALRLEFLGINTVTPIALVEERIGPLRGRAYFVSEYIEGPDASQLDQKDNPEREITAIADIVRSLTAAGVSHGDLKATNFLLSRHGAVIIDLDSMTEYRSTAARSRAQRRDRERFMRNWQPEISQRFAELLG